MTEIESFNTRFEKIEPWLLKTIWPPLTYMMIPSVLNGADELILELQQAVGASPDLAPLLQKMEELRRNFRRDTSYLSS